MKEKVQEKKMDLKGSRTATLWLQYSEMIDILQRFIMAERTGNWKLHLSEMMPYLPSSGHSFYVK